MQEVLNITKLDKYPMDIFKTTLKKWGNSTGVTIPKNLLKGKHLRAGKPITLLIIEDDMDAIRKTFGTVKFDQSVKDIMREVDEDFNHD